MSEERYVQTPDWALLLGEWSVERLTKLELISSRLRPFTTLRAQLDNEEGRLAEAFSEGDTATLGLGDRETGLAVLFHGEVEEIDPQRMVTLRARDQGMLRLARHLITRCWLRVTPQEVARDVLGAAGVPYSLGSTTLPRRHHVVACGISVLELLQQMARQWDLDWDLYCEVDGTLWWGPWHQSPRYELAMAGDLVVLEHGLSAFEIEPSESDVGRAVTWLQPGLRHSAIVGIEDARFWRQQRLARVERVRHRLGGGWSSASGAAPAAVGGRTELEWRLLA